jgi:Fic family protein
MVNSPPMDDYIHQSNLIEGYDDLRADQMSLAAWDWLIRRNRKTLEKFIVCHLQKRITLFQTDLQPEWRGQYRKIDVWVGGRKGKAPALIDRAMENWMQVLHFTHPKTAHVEFEKIHPFADGNGRVGRMLMWWQQLQRGEELTYISFENRWDYYDWFEET